MVEEKKDEIDIVNNIEDTPSSIKKNLMAEGSIKFKNIKVKAGKIHLKFPVEIISDRETKKEENKKNLEGGEEIELKNVFVEHGNILISIPQFEQEIISPKSKK